MLPCWTLYFDHFYWTTFSRLNFIFHYSSSFVILTNRSYTLLSSSLEGNLWVLHFWESFISKMVFLLLHLRLLNQSPATLSYSELYVYAVLPLCEVLDESCSTCSISLYWSKTSISTKTSIFVVLKTWLACCLFQDY